MKQTAHNSRRKAQLAIVLSALFSLALGYWLGHGTHALSCDFRAIYYGARSVTHNHDPYKPAEFLRVYDQDKGEYPTNLELLRNFKRAVPVCVNLPSTLFLVSPLTLLPWHVAQCLWMLLVAGGMAWAGILMLDLGWKHRPGLSLFLICLLLANCQLLFQLGNASALAIVLLCFSIWTLLREKFAVLGVIGLAIALAIKPQEVGLVWLYFLFLGGAFRKRALQSAALAAVIALAGVAWVSTASPHWADELHANIQSTTARGDLNDPGPSSIGNTRVSTIVSLQSVISFIKDDPRVYNPASFLLAGALIALWAFITLRTRCDEESFWLGLCCIVPLSMLPVYHREYDLKLLILCIPAAAMLSTSNQRFARWIIAASSAGIVLTADIPLACLAAIKNSLHLSLQAHGGKIATVLLARVPTLALLALSIFFCAVYFDSALRRSGRAYLASSAADPKFPSPEPRDGFAKFPQPASEVAGFRD